MVSRSSLKPRSRPSKTSCRNDHPAGQLCRPVLIQISANARKAMGIMMAGVPSQANPEQRLAASNGPRLTLRIRHGECCFQILKLGPFKARISEGLLEPLGLPKFRGYIKKPRRIRAGLGKRQHDRQVTKSNVPHEQELP
jgi:hypothetical protein